MSNKKDEQIENRYELAEWICKKVMTRTMCFVKNEKNALKREREKIINIARHVVHLQNSCENMMRSYGEFFTPEKREAFNISMESHRRDFQIINNSVRELLVGYVDE